MSPRHYTLADQPTTTARPQLQCARPGHHRRQRADRFRHELLHRTPQGGPPRLGIYRNAYRARPTDALKLLCCTACGRRCL